MRFDGLFVSRDPATAGAAADAPARAAPPAAPHQPMAFKVALGPAKAGGAGAAAGAGAADRHQQARSSSALVTAALLILAASAAIVYATMRSEGEHAVAEPVASASPAPHVHKTDPVAAARFARPTATSCDGRVRCSQMNSCAEAKYFLANCPVAAEMDSNLNGIPCDTQWCTAGAADQAAR